jgi:hypothetical protein
MTNETRDLINRLKLEIQVIESGGYWPSVREPRKEPRLFRDSVSCPNAGLEVKQEPCSHCFLMDFVPAQLRDRDDACKYIPLTKEGDTIASLEAEGDHERAKEALLAWLKQLVARLEGVAA